MEINANVIISLLFVSILILLFSKISVSVGSNDNTNTISPTRPVISKLNITNNHSISNSSRPLTLAEANRLPPKDDYMSNSLRQQLNDLENKFYYNNCRWEPNF